MSVTDNADETMRIQNALIRDEKLVLKPYRDTKSKLTIGVGRNLDDKGISELEAMILLDNDVRDAERAAVKALPWIESLTEPRRAVIIMLTFNMGIGGLLTFTHLLEALQHGNWVRAASELLDSTYHREAPARCERLADQLRSGIWA